MLLIFLAFASCARGGGGVDQALSDCRAGDQQACGQLSALMQRNAGADSAMPHSERVKLDVSAIMAGMDRARAHEVIVGRVVP
jgi:hypothetical protein